MARYLRSYPNQPVWGPPPILTGLVPAPGLSYTTPRFLIKDLAGQTTTPTVATNINAGGISVTVGALPTGLSIDSTTGVISGTPTVVENQIVTIQGVGDGGTTTFQLTINVVTNLTPAIESVIPGVLIDLGTIRTTVRSSTVH